MAKSQAFSNDNLRTNIVTSNTGHAESPAKGAPMSSKITELLGGEQTSDGAAAERRIEKSREKNTIERPSHGDKLRDESLQPHLPKKSKKNTK